MISAIQLDDSTLQQQLDAFPRALRGALGRGLEEATNLLRSTITSLADAPLGVPSSGAFGEFAGSVTTAVSDESGRPVGTVFLGPPADRYGIFVEVGSAPHFPPPAALEGWVRRRLGITQGRQVREVAFLIGRKISRQGTQGQFFFERALRDNESKAVAILERAVAGALQG